MPTAESWRMRGDVIDACSCNYACPCNFGNDPSKGFCEGVVSFHIQEGNYGETRLDSLNLVLLVRFPGNAFDGHWTLGTYLDQRANQEQCRPWAPSSRVRRVAYSPSWALSSRQHFPLNR